MANAMNLNVRITGSLCDFVAENISDTGNYDNVSEYIRDLIRQDKQRKEQHKFEQLKAELKLVFSAPEEDYLPLTAEDIFRRNDVIRSS